MSEPLTPAEREELRTATAPWPPSYLSRLLDERDALERKVQILGDAGLKAAIKHEAERDTLRTQLETVTSDYTTDQDAYLDAQNQMAALRAQLEKLTADFRTPEPCGHMKNFAIGDEYGHFSCTVCRCEQLEREVAAKTLV